MMTNTEGTTAMMTAATTAALIKFAADCAATELELWDQSQSNPDSSPCMGMWQTFQAEFPTAGDAEWNLVCDLYRQAVEAGAAAQGVEAVAFS